MTTAIIGLFENADIANKVVGELTKSGFKKDAIEILQNVAVSKISSRLVEAGYEKDKAESYAKAMQQGGALIVAEAPDDKAEEALSTMRKFQALSPEALLEKISKRMLEFRDVDTGAPVVDALYAPAKIFKGKHLEHAPDLLIGFKPGYRSSWQTALGAVPRQTVIPNTEAWVGDHCIASHFVPGVLLSYRKSKLADPQLADLTVTLLEEFSAPRADGMIGRNIY